jgi:hypothetical protein
MINSDLKTFHKSDSENEKVIILTLLPSSLHALYSRKILNVKLDNKES